VFGFRPTHGALPLDGVVPFAPGYDTVGWMSRRASLLHRVGAVLLGQALEQARPAWAISVATDVFDAAEPATARVLRPLADALAASTGNLLRDGGPVQVFDGPAEDWLSAYATLQGGEIRASLGPWITKRRPRFGPSIAPRFDAVFGITDAQVHAATAWREAQRRRLLPWFNEGRVMVLPTAPCPALPVDADEAARTAFYARALAITSIAGHLGLPQVTLPVARVDERPVGLSIIGPPGADMALLALARHLDDQGFPREAAP
jgi:amidase